jgi:hypothetical protein
MKTLITISFILLTIAMMFTGCYTENKAKKRLYKVQAHHPSVITKLCADLYPAGNFKLDSIVYLQGSSFIAKDTLYVYDTIQSILKQQIISYKLRVDTVYRLKSIETSNKARELMLSAQNAEVNTLLEVKKSQNKLLFWIVIVLGAYTILRWVLRFWGVRLP